MRSVAVKPEYGPTLGRMLSPSWRSAPRAARVTAVIAGAAVVVALAALVLTLLNSTYSRGAPPFHFSYRGLHRTAPEAGGYVRVRAPAHGAAVQYSFAVNPLRLPPYRGAPGAAVPLYAGKYIGALRSRYPDLILRGEGKSRINSSLSGYQIAYTATIAGREMMGRDVLLVHERPGVRDGLAIVMLTAPGANRQITSPLEIASTGVLQRPLKTFSLG
jgi:hypothetical protein